MALHFAGKEALQLNVSFKAFGSAVCSQKSSVDAYCIIRVQELLLAVVSKAIQKKTEYHIKCECVCTQMPILFAFGTLCLCHMTYDVSRPAHLALSTTSTAIKANCKRM